MTWTPWTLGRRLRAVEKRQAAYTDAVVAAIIAANSAGSVQDDATETGAVEIAAGVISRAFASASVEGAAYDIHPEQLADMARDLVVRGESLFVRVTDSNGDDTLARASSWEVSGKGPTQCDWRYRIDLAVPDGSRKVVKTGDEVVHPRYSADSTRPWVGVPPIERAKSAGKLAARTEATVGNEFGGPVGYVLPLPTDGNDNSVDALKNDIKSMAGNVAIVETTAGGWGQGRSNAPAADWRPQRIGPNPPEAVPKIMERAQLVVLAALGIPIEIVTAADGTGQREAWRRFLHGTVEPLSRIIEDQLERVNDDRRSVNLTFERLFASDIAGRARAFQSLVGAGLDPAEAAAQAGLLEPGEAA